MRVPCIRVSVLTARQTEPDDVGWEFGPFFTCLPTKCCCIASQNGRIPLESGCVISPLSS